MATIHAFVRQYGSEEDNAAEETVHYGSSTSNKVRTVLDTSMEILVVQFDCFCTVVLIKVAKREV